MSDVENAKDSKQAMGLRIKRNREASLEDCRRLLEQLHPDPLQRWDEYDNLRRKLVMFFQYSHSLDANELAEEAIDRVAKKLGEDSVANITEFAFGVARNLRKEAYRRDSRKMRLSAEESMDDFPTHWENSENTIIESIDNERARTCFLECMKKLPPADRALILQYYPAQASEDIEKHRRMLAEVAGMKIGGLRTRMTRLRSKLVNCLVSCRRTLLHRQRGVAT